MSNQVTTTEDAIFNEILRRSAHDREYRTLLVNDPGAAIEEVLGVPLSTLPQPVRVRFIEKEAGLDAMIVLPDLVDAEGTLSEAELEAVAGGEWCFTSCGWSCLIGSESVTIIVCTQH